MPCEEVTYHLDYHIAFIRIIAAPSHRLRQHSDSLEIEQIIQNLFIFKRIKLPVCVFLVFQTVDSIVVLPPSSELLIPTVDDLLMRAWFRVRMNQSAVPSESSS